MLFYLNANTYQKNSYNYTTFKILYEVCYSFKNMWQGAIIKIQITAFDIIFYFIDFKTLMIKFIPYIYHFHNK